MPAHLRNKFSWATGWPVSHWCPRQFMATGGLHQRYSTCGISACPPRDTKKCHDPGVEERPNRITVHSLPPMGRWGGFNSNTTTRDLLYQKVMAAYGLLGLSRLSNRKDIKAILPFEMNTKSLEESPASPSTTGCWSPQERPSIHSQRSEWSAPSIRTCFPFIGSMTSCSRATSERSGLNGGKASDWLRPESTA